MKLISPLAVNADMPRKVKEDNKKKKLVHDIKND